MKKIHFEPEVPAQVRAIPQHVALTILEAIHRYADTGAGRVKPLSGEFEGFLRLRVGNHRVFFKETADTVNIHRVRRVDHPADLFRKLEKRNDPFPVPLPKIGDH